MLDRILKRRRYVKGAEKIHTSIYLLPRHRAHLEFMMNSHGKTMNACICELIDASIRNNKQNNRAI